MIWATTNSTANPTAPGAKDTAQKLFARLGNFLGTLGIRTMYGFDPTHVANLNLGVSNQALSEVSMLVFLTPNGASAEQVWVFTLVGFRQWWFGSGYYSFWVY